MVSRVVAAVACAGIALPAPAAAFSLSRLAVPGEIPSRRLVSDFDAGGLMWCLAGFGGMIHRFRNGGMRGQARTQCTYPALPPPLRL